MIAVAGGGAGKAGEVAIAARIDERGGAQPMQATVVLEGDLGDPVAVTLRRPDEGVQEDLHAGFRAQLVERTLHRLGIEDHEYPAMPDGERDGIEAAELAKELARDPADRLACLVAQRVETTVGQNVANGRGAAKASRLFDQRGPRAASRGRNSSRDAGTSSAHHDDVEVLLLAHRNVLLFTGALVPASDRRRSVASLAQRRHSRRPLTH